MKTPREILLARHKVVEPKLDDIRRECVGQASRLSPVEKKKKSETGRMSVLQLLWHELFLPSRRIWTGLAAVWIVILAVNFSLRDNPQTTMAKASSSPQMVLALRQQEQMLTELIGPNDPPAAEPQKSYAPRPSSQRRPEILTA
jgi:hypothetical protein